MSLSPVAIGREFLYLGESLQYFFERAKINIYQGNTAINLLDYFHLLRYRISIGPIINIALLLYMDVNNLLDPNDNRFVIPDDLMTKSFNDDIPASFYSNVTFLDRSMLMTQAVNSGIISRPLNIFEMISKNNKTFNPLNFDKSIRSNIGFLGTYPEFYIENYENYLNDENIKTSLCNEETLIFQIQRVLSELKVKYLNESNYNLSNITLYDFLSIAIEIRANVLIDYLINFDGRVPQQSIWISLLYAIITNDIDLVSELVKNIDPRINNNEAYKLALKIGNQTIIKLINDVIIERNFIVKEALTTMIEPLVGPTDIPKILSNYITNRLY